jgi:hypothetical protein
LPVSAVGEEEDETKKKERARLLELVEQTIKEIEAARVAVLAGIAERDRKS